MRPGHFSIVITTYNCSAFCEQAIASALAQTAPNKEVIVVDDGSSDSTAELCRAFTGITLLENEHRGVAAARRTGVDASSGEYLVFLDGDDYLADSYLDETWGFLRTKPSATFCYTWMQMFGTNDSVLRLSEFCRENLVLDGNHIGIGALQPRSLFYSVGGFDPTLTTHEDWDYWIKAVERGHRGVCLQKPLYYYRQHAVGVSRNADWKRYEHQIKQEVWRRHRLLYYACRSLRGLRRVRA